MNFDAKWVKWLMECVTSVYYTLLFNGNISNLFKPGTGLRQGDPISPYLFLICANILSLALRKAESSNIISGVKVGRNGDAFTHLLYDDDSLLFLRKMRSF